MAPVNFTNEQLQSLRTIPHHEYIMASQAVNTTAQSPAAASTEASQVDYFGSSSQSSTTTSSRTSVEIQDRNSITAPTTTTTAQKSTKHSNPLPPLSRDFPKPAEEINVTEALARKPGRWTFQGALAAARPAPVVDEEKAKAQRIKALEDAKKELFAASETLKTVPLPARKNAF